MPTQKAGFNLDLSGLDAIASVAKQRAITLKAVKAGAKLVQAAAKSKAPKRSGALRQSLGIKSKKGTRGKTLALAIVGARTKVQKMVKVRGRSSKVLAVPSKYSHLVEKGTKPHGGHPGAKAKPFLRPAFDATKDAAGAAGARVMIAEVEKAIAQQAAKFAKKGGK